MSYALTAYVVDLDVLHRSVASEDDRLRRMIGGRFKRQLEHFDGQFAGPDLLPVREAIRAVIEGGPFDPEQGTMYGYAYRWICEFHGRFLDNSDFSPMRAGWLETVGEGMRALGVTAVDVEDFGLGHAPEPIPAPDFLPCYGEWSPERCRKALEQWESATDTDRAGLDPYVLQAVEACMGWCRTADAAGRGVAGFFS
ncbi:hypothetical protein SUDANB121_00466 [Nocardiopsis dassonvillei]|uniref:DUF7691 family protein n=1 Tax=Nocardiopsis dassonvillei TaxID=2014 RepID=UPI003F544CA9